MAGNILLEYVADTAMTVTNLHSLASSQTWVAGWGSASVDNTTNDYIDYMVSGTFTTHASNRQAGEVEVWCLAAIEDTPTWPATATGTVGTEGALSFTAAEMKYSYGRLLTTFSVTNTASQIYAFPPTSIGQLYGGICPAYWALFVTGNASTTTTAQFASSGSAVYYKPVHHRYT